jgi:type I restriction enzyme S subunit
MNQSPTARLADKAKVLMGQSPPSAVCSETGEGLPFIQGNAEFGRRHPIPILRCCAPTRVAEAGDLLVSVRAPVGGLNQAVERTVIGRGLSALRFEPSQQSFAWHSVRFAVPGFNRVAQGSTFLAVSREDVERLEIPWHEEANPDIAAVLDTVDEAIANTEAVIAKLRQVRAGLLHDLLTRGLDGHGQLRDPIAHPEQFQDSALGRIPKEWSCKTLGDAADWFSGGTPSRSQSAWWNGEVPILTPKDMKVFEISDTIEHVTMEAAVAGSKVMPPETAFIVVRGMILAHTFPVCLSTRPFAFNQDIKAVRGRAELTTRFLAHWFAANASVFLRKTTEATHGTKKLDSKELHRTPIGVPEPEEQATIVERIEAFDSAIAGDGTEVGKLQQMKSGLMTDLLTGRVRVPEVLETTQ